MNKKDLEYIESLIYYGEKIEKVGFRVLLASDRNNFFSYLENFIKLHNETRTKLLEKYSLDTIGISDPNQIHTLHYKDYKSSRVVQFLMLITFPISWILFLKHWIYLNRIKKQVVNSLEIYRQLL